MTRHKKNKQKPTPAHHNNNTDTQPAGAAEEILEEVVEVKELLTKTKQKLRESDSLFGYLLSKKWLGSWKSYTGFDALAKNESPEDSKGFGKRKPSSKINDDLLAKADSKYIKIPESLVEFGYLNVPIDADFEDEKEYTVVDEQLWLSLQGRYPDAICIRRPLRKRKSGQPYVDVHLHHFNVVFVSPESVSSCKSLSEEQFKETLKRKKNNDTLENIFPVKKIRLPAIWNLGAVRKFLQQMIPLSDLSTKKVEGINFWKMQNYLSFAEVREGLCSFFRGDSEGVLATSLEVEEEADKDIDDIIKTSYVIVVSYSGVPIVRTPPPKEITGYCQQCIQDKVLKETCLCQNVFYCCRKCKYDDKNYHLKSCDLAYDSEDDEEYLQKSVYVDTSELRCGLVNLGNTCYMNSSLQCLTNLNFLFDYFSSNKYTKLLNEDEIKDNKGVFIHKVAKFIKKMNEVEEYSPYSLKAQIGYFIAPFKGYSQQDANDFIIYFLTTLNDFSSKNLDNDAYATFIAENMLGKFKSTVTCPECCKESTTIDLFTQVPLPIKSKTAEKQIQYVRISSWNEYEKGTTLVKNTWNELYQDIGEKPECRKWVGGEGEAMKEIIEETPEEVYKKHKKETILIYSNLGHIPNTMEIRLNLVYMRIVAGNEMRLNYGYPVILSLEPGTHLWEVYHKIAELLGIDKSTIQQLDDLKSRLDNQIKAIKEGKKKEKEEREKKEEREEKELKEPEKKSRPEQDFKYMEELTAEIIKIEEKFTEELKQLRSKLKFRLVVANGRKGKKPCYYCRKKCQQCTLPFSVETTLAEFQKRGDQGLQIDIFQDEKADVTETHTKNSSYNKFTTLEECLEEFSLPEQLDMENPWYCHFCDDMRLAWKQLKINEYPKVLVFQLKRFKDQNGKKVKNNEAVWYPQVLCIKENETKYQFSSVVIHEGSLENGHYWAVCRKGGDYLVFNDEEIKKTSEYFHKNAYILFYEMIE